MAEELRAENPLDFDGRAAASTSSRAADVRGRRRVAPSAPSTTLPDGWLGLDIGPETRDALRRADREARTIFWNGPMGVFEWPRFAEGTKAVAAGGRRERGRFSVVGGADSVRALNELGLADRVSWVSTGGGACLELLEGKELPGVAAIPE